MRSCLLKLISVLFFLFLMPFFALSQFAPQAGFAGTTAIHKDSSIIKTFNNYHLNGIDVSLKRGWQNIADTNIGKATVGSADSIWLNPNGYMLSLGDGGSINIKLRDPIINGQGPDFVVFENGFPFSEDSFFLELAFVEVSNDGENYFRFPAVSLTDTIEQVGPFGGLKAHHLHNFAGKYIMPFGVPFDLSELKDSLAPKIINYIRLVDVVGSIFTGFGNRDNIGRLVNDPWPTPFPSSGFDLHAIGFINLSISEGENDFDFKSAIKVFPNPVVQGEKIEVIFPTNLMRIKLFDVLGKEVYSENCEESQTTHNFTANFLPGVYHLLLQKGGNYISKSKLIIKP